MTNKALEVGRFALLMGIILAIGFLGSNFVGLSRAGFDSLEIFNLQNFYMIGVAFALGLFALKIYQVSSNKGDETYGSSVSFASIGLKPHFKFFKRFTGLQLFLLSMILFGFAMFVNLTFIAPITGQTSYTSVGIIESQQFTATESVVYATLLIPIAENLGLAFLIALIMVILGIIARKRKLDTKSHLIILFATVFILAGAFGLGNHFFRYSGLEITLLNVFFFWAIGGIMTVATGSFIPFWVLHMMNKLALELSELFSSEATILFSIIVILLSGAIYYFIFKDNLLGKKRENE